MGRLALAQSHTPRRPPRPLAGHRGPIRRRSACLLTRPLCGLRVGDRERALSDGAERDRAARAA